MRSLVPRPDEGEPDVKRVRAFAAQVTDDPIEIDLILYAAKDLERQVSNFDRQTQQLKDEHFRPVPDGAVMARLEQLQRQKEQLIRDVITSLTSRLNHDDARRAGKAVRGIDRVNSHLNDHVKRGVTAVTPPSPLQHHGVRTPLGAFLGFTASAFTAASAAQWMGQGYTYSNVAVNYSGGQIYGYGATAETYSSYGHQYQVNANLSVRGENRQAVWVSQYTYPYIQSPTLILPIVNPFTRMPTEGIADMFTSGSIKCPYSYVVHSMATALSSIRVQQTIAMGEVRFTSPDPVVIRKGETAELTVPLQASPNLPAGTTVTELAPLWWTRSLCRATR